MTRVLYMAASLEQRWQKYQQNKFVVYRDLYINSW